MTCELSVHLIARHGADVWNVPSFSRKCVEHRNHHHDEKYEVNHGSDEIPNHGKETADRRNRPENAVQDAGQQIEQQPGRAEDDGLHGVETDETVALLQQIKDNAADQWEASQSGSDV